MKARLLTVSLIIVFGSSLFAQQTNPLPRGFAPGEEALMNDYLESRQAKGISTPPPYSSLRTAAEWEEVQSLVITWTGDFPSIQAQIIDAAQEECEVIIMCNSASSVQSSLTNYGVPLTNLQFLETGFNTLWIRDYGANTVYVDDVGELILVDWIYNRPRPIDDEIPDAYAALKGYDIYSTTASPNDIVATGGNYMSDGEGVAFSSELILDENDGTGGSNINYPTHTTAEIDAIYEDWMGITDYIKMTVLPYDEIHHIDMHMKLLDEETLLIGEFPEGTSDGPQIEANIQYVLDNYQSRWGTPFKIIRIPMPASTSGTYPNGTWSGASYRTYANQIFVNKTILLPTYREETDTTAMRILEEALPGYNIVGIDVDNSGENLISLGGAIHCITHTIGVEDPMWISHQRLSDTYNTATAYVVDALIKHNSGIASGTVYYSTDGGSSWSTASMADAGSDSWSGSIPAQAAGTTIRYYVEGTANSGKALTRPIVAPEGYWEFDVLGPNGINEYDDPALMGDIYPNPASAITVVPVNVVDDINAELIVYNMLGEAVEVLHSGTFSHAQKNYFIDASYYAPGVYNVVFRSEQFKQVQKLVVR